MVKMSCDTANSTQLGPRIQSLCQLFLPNEGMNGVSDNWYSVSLTVGLWPGPAHSVLFLPQRHHNKFLHNENISGSHCT